MKKRVKNFKLILNFFAFIAFKILLILQTSVCLANQPQVAGGAHHTVGLKTDGTLVAVGDNDNGECNVEDWTNIVQVAAGTSFFEPYTVGLKSDGTVIAGECVGWNRYGQCDVDGWSGIIQVAAGSYHTVGLKSNGTVEATGRNDTGQCNVISWSGIVQIAAGFYPTVGLKSDGTVLAEGCVSWNDFGQCDVGNWRDIIQVTAGDLFVVGVKSDGTVMAAGDNRDGQCDVDDWTNIIQVAAGDDHTVGLKSDGTVISVGWNRYGQCDVDGWSDIIQVAAGTHHTLGLKSDGTVLAAGCDGISNAGQCDIDDWNLIVAPTIDDILNFFKISVANGTLKGCGKTKWMARRNLKKIRRMLKIAGYQIKKGKINAACKRLDKVYMRCDGEPRPKDYVKGENTTELIDMSNRLMISLNCE